MKKLIYILFFVVSPSLCFAEDGLVVQFTIDEVSNNGQERVSYTDALMMTFGEEHTFEVRELYVIKFHPVLIDDGKISLVTTLKDIDDSKPYYVGAAAVELKVGDAEVMSMERNESSYKVSVDTSYGKLQ
ncbi:hypothetical protein [Marinimicrobium agarilyticum]|uniref:hypothetical protein n=1 Tax=Marinimicrobium agarilyticum TaxID=306546 RepID=UPI000485C96D|nr:hypothetical protein [Marinimicrobium agarilyticum]